MQNTPNLPDASQASPKPVAPHPLSQSQPSSPVKTPSQVDKKKKRKKKLLWIAGGVIVVLIFAATLIFLWAWRSKKSLSERKRNTIEIPEDVDYENIDSDQFEDLLKEGSSKYPNEALPASEEGDPGVPLIEDFIFTQDGQDIPPGQTPPEGDVVIDPSTPDELNPPDDGDDGDDGGDGEDGDFHGPHSVGTMFTTLGTWDGDLNGIDGADAKCQNEAQDQGFTGTWVALLSYTNFMNQQAFVNAKDRIPDTVYKNVAGQQIAANKADLFDGTIDHRILYPNGQPPDNKAWTGSANDDLGTLNMMHANPQFDTCFDWTCNAPYDQTKPSGCASTHGIADKLDSEWIYAAEQGCNNASHLYCVKTDLNQPQGDDGDGWDEDPDHVPDDGDGSDDPEDLCNVFLTKGEYTGDVNGHVGSDDVCQQEAENAGLPGLWMAMNSTQAVSMKDKVPNVVFRNAKSEVIIRGKRWLFEATHEKPILFPDGSEPLATDLARTGTSVTGDTYQDTCWDWTCSGRPGAESECYSSVGNPTRLDSNWVSEQDKGCDEKLHFYCFKAGDEQGPIINYTSFNETRSEEEQEEIEGKLEEIQGVVEKYYPDIVELYGEPYRADRRVITFAYSSDIDVFSYLPQYDTVIVNHTSPWLVVPALVAAFHGDYHTNVPETWEYGMMYAITQLAIFQHPEDVNAFALMGISQAKVNYEKFNVKDFPIWGASIFYDRDILEDSFALNKYRPFLADMALMKPYQYDNGFFKKLNEKLYSISVDSAIWEDELQVFNTVFTAFPNVEGETPQTWYSKQHVLHQTETNALAILVMRLVGQTFILEHYGIRNFTFKSTVTDNGVTFVPRADVSRTIQVKNDRGNTLKELNKSTDSDGQISHFDLETVGVTEDGRYSLTVTNNNVENHFVYTDDMSKRSGLHGAVLNFGQGKIALYKGGDQIEEADIENGFFNLKKAQAGVYKVKVKDKNGTQVLEKELALDIYPYFAVLDSPSDSYSDAPVTGGRGSEQDEEQTETSDECADIDSTNWQTYENLFTVKYPQDWSYEEYQTSDASNPWLAAFGPQGPMSETAAVWVGTIGKPLDLYKQDLTQYNIEAEESTTIDENEGTRLTVAHKTSGVKEYIYYIPFFNIAYLFKGSVEDSSFCEATIFQEMLKTYEFPSLPGEEGEEAQDSGEDSDWQQYYNVDCSFILYYPQGWEIQDVEYYETAGGVQSTVPTVYVNKIGEAHSGSNSITINMRQASCMDMSTPDVDVVNERTINFYTAPDGYSWCAEAEIQGLDKNGATGYYHFVSHYDDSEVTNIFREMVSRFTVTE